MQVHQMSSKKDVELDLNLISFQPDLILAFGSKTQLEKPLLQEIRLNFPQAILAGCSTAGEIAKTSVLEEELVLNFLKFDKASVSYQEIELQDPNLSYSSATQWADGTLLE